MSFSDSYETTVLKWLLTTDSVTRPTEWYVALFTAAPSDAGGGTEVTGGSYARKAVTFTVTGNAATNSSAITFDTATASWGTITHAAIFDAVSGGTMVAWDALDSSTTIGLADTAQLQAGDIDVTLD